MEAAAIAVGRQPLSVLAAIGEVSDPIAAVDAAAGAGLLEHRRRGPDVLVRPRDPLERAAILEGMTLARSTALHTRAAEVVEDPGVAWSHRVRAMVGPDPEVAATLDGVAAQAAADGRWRHAGWAWLNAHRVSPPGQRGARLVRAVDAFVGAGELDVAGGLLAELTEGDVGPLGDAVRGYRHAVQGNRAEAEHLLRRAVDQLDDSREAPVSEVHHRLALHALLDWDCEAVIAHSEAAILAGAAGAPSPAAVEARTMLGLGLAGVGRTEEALAEYAAVTREVSDGPLAQRAVMGAGWVNLALGDVVDSARALELSAPTEFWKGSTRISLWARAWLARAQLRLGQLDAVRETVDTALDLANRTGQCFAEPLLHWSGAEAAALEGDDEEADRHVRLAGRSHADYLVMLVPAVLARATPAQIRGDAREVLRALEPLLEVERGPRGGRLDEPGFWPWHDVYAKALVAIGEPDRALAFLAPHEERSRRRGHLTSLARLSAVRGRALAAHGDLADAVTLFEHAIAVTDGAHDPLLRAQLLLDEGQVLRRGGRRRDAESVLARARARFDAMGAAACVATCDDELRAGGRSGRTVHSTKVILTEHEQRIADLVASGLSNKEVSARLFVTTKTVQYHLTRIYAQLGVRSRTELAARWPDVSQTRETANSDATDTDGP